MRLIFCLLLISAFHLTPQQTVLHMGKAVFTPDKIIKVQGINNEGKKIALEFNKKNATLKKEGESHFLEKDEFPLFLQLFFFSHDFEGEKAPETFSNKLLSSLVNAGIDVKKETLTVVDSTNEAGISIGKNKRFSSTSELVLYKDSFLPATLKLSNETYHFLDYSKSVKPMAFPGRIDISQNGKVVETWTFYRKEFYPD